MKFNLVSVLGRIGSVVRTAKNSLKIGRFVVSQLKPFRKYVPTAVEAVIGKVEKYVPSDANLDKVEQGLEVAGNVTENVLHRYTSAKPEAVVPGFGRTETEIAEDIANNMH